MTPQERILELRRELHEHNRRYYVLNSPTISDYEFDMLLKELEGYSEYAKKVRWRLIPYIW